MVRLNTSRRARWLATAILILGMAAAAAPAASVVGAEPTDMVLDWNQHAASALSTAVVGPPAVPGQTPPVASLHMAMVQGAVYDAVNAIDGGHEPYLEGLPAVPASASKAAAAATAAHHVLVGLVPALPASTRTNLDALYAASLAEITDGQAKSDGVAIGAAAAAAMLLDRTGDGRFTTHSFRVGTLPGQWRPVLPAFVNDPFAWVAKVRPFTLNSASQLRTAGPLALTSPEYAAEFNEVKALGALTGSSRTPGQTALAGFVTGNPLIMMNRAFREISTARGLSTEEQARLFAITSMASADALIACWDDKDHWSFWRPITAIREAASDGNPATAPQADWLPLFANPPYPDHPSGYNCYTGAMMNAAKAFFGGNRTSFKLVQPATGVVRSYKHFTAVVRDTIDGRLYTGFHFRTPDVAGAWIGKKAALWVNRNFFGDIR